MGMYTELVLGVKIEPTESILSILRYMLGDTADYGPHEYHDLFTTVRWHYMLRCDSYYFDGQTDSKLYEDHGEYYINVRCNLQNYSDEIDLFLDWLQPYIVTNGFIGYKRYEEFDDPTLIYNDYGKIVYKQVRNER